MKFERRLDGRKNDVALMSSGSDSLVRKRFAHERAPFYHREKEVLLGMAASGFTNRIVDFDDDNRELLYEYYPGRHPSFKDSSQLARAVSLLHYEMNELVQYNDLFRRDPCVDAQFISGYYGMDMYTSNVLSEVISSGEDSIIHGHLLPENVIVGDDGIRFIDWEFTSNNHAGIDIGYLAGYLENREVFVNSYKEYSANQHTMKLLNAGRYHLSALTLALYQRESNPDELVTGRMKRLEDWLVSESFEIPEQVVLRHFFEKVFR